MYQTSRATIFRRTAGTTPRSSPHTCRLMRVYLLSSGRKGRMPITVHGRTPHKAQMRDLSSGITKCLRTRVKTEISVLPWRWTRQQIYRKVTLKDPMRSRHWTLRRRAMRGPLDRPVERAAPEVRTQCSTLAIKDRLATFKDRQSTSPSRKTLKILLVQRLLRAHQ